MASQSQALHERACPHFSVALKARLLSINIMARDKEGEREMFF